MAETLLEPEGKKREPKKAGVNSRISAGNSARTLTKARSLIKHN